MFVLRVDQKRYNIILVGRLRWSGGESWKHFVKEKREVNKKKRSMVAHTCGKRPKSCRRPIW